MDEIRKFVAPEFIYGVGSRSLAASYAARLGISRPMVVSDPGVRDVGWSGELMDSLAEAGISAEQFLSITPNPKDVEVMAGVEQYRAAGCDGLIVIGGGSPMDAAKGIGIVSACGGHIVDYEGVDCIPAPGPPLICIPTTSGTAADLSQFAIISDTFRLVKIAIVSKAAVPDLALIDPQVTETMEEALTASTGMDALVHAVEAWCSNASSPVTDVHAEQAMKLVFAHLRTAVASPHDMEARAAMSLASTHAGLAFSNASLGAVHAMAHALGGLTDSAHGESNALLLPEVLEYNAVAVPERIAAIGPFFGVCTDVAAVVDVVRSLQEDVGMNIPLSRMGVERDSLSRLAENAMADACMVTNPRVPTAEEIEQLYERVF